jgi:hypothetical protein
MVSKVKTHYHKRTHKYGIEIPKSVKDVLNLDPQSGTYFLREAIAKETNNFMPAFKFRKEDQVPSGYTNIDCHMLFDINSTLQVRIASWRADI